MADWVAIYERSEDNLLKMLEERAQRLKAQQPQQISSQATTGTTTMSQEEKPRD